MEFDEVSVGVRVDIAVDRAVNLFAVLDQAASRFADRGAVYRGERRCARPDRQPQGWSEAGEIYDSANVAAFAQVHERLVDLVELVVAGDQLV
jgi:hypothetical protein